MPEILRSGTGYGGQEVLVITLAMPRKEAARGNETGENPVNIQIFFPFLAQPYLSFEMTN